MPSFHWNFRRKSSKSTTASNASSDGSTGVPPIPTSKSSSTLSSNQQTTPPPSLPENGVASSKPMNGHSRQATVKRPSTTNNSSKRHSMINLSGNNSPPPTGMPQQRPPLPPTTTSPFSPHVTSIGNRETVYQKMLLISGQIGEEGTKAMDGVFTINHLSDTSFPASTWPVNESHFKALVHLHPGPNRLRFDFASPKLSTGNPSKPLHSTFFDITYVPLNNAPPLHLAILLGKDSPGTFDAPPDRIQREGNDLDTAMRKFRMASYLWQAFTGEQMYRNGFGRRCWRYEEEWQPGTLTIADSETSQYRNEAKIHIIRTEKTVEEIRDLNKAQQYDQATDKGALFGIAMEAVKAHFKPAPGQKQYVSCMFLDTCWDTQAKVVRGHAALGGGDGEVGLAIFGSHALHSYPSCIEEVVPTFSDCTRTDTNFVANDCNESGSTWEAANIGIGAHLHETGHLFGCPHQESGVMLRDYVRFNRTFATREPYSTRTQQHGKLVCSTEDECNWHRLDCLRFRFHPCFRLPLDKQLASDNDVQVWSGDNKEILITTDTGVAWMELYPQGDDVCHHWIDYTMERQRRRDLSLSEDDLRKLLPSDKRKKPLKIEIYSFGGGKHVVDDFDQLISKTKRVKLPGGGKGFIASKLGYSQLEGSQPQEIVLDCIENKLPKRVLMSIRIYHGYAIDGIEFMYDDKTSQLFGKRGGTPGGSEFKLDLPKHEFLVGFYIRAGLWIDGIQIITNQRKSEIYGNPVGGSGHKLIPPSTYKIAGLTGSCGSWLDGFALIITR
ncbi:uncharacterized protein K452DRAFT_295910 [Aplosporella prunicola CBS 121167]|uniref:Jacalin-type lectin domain-containing protein n=1 Tax=Aplosporella prunicola CBS 121167 TaxID=1176127 RepID=A0A6A6BMG8_9PEZI|nr:uncharacterized protein K452DRAFT_295910 [Aplosporella prunicola CBS 121167]KAF2144465.1 hypothetical protein K452DRAFT_295910 [Aplosporella prunicola CBS 121167]